MHKFLRFFSNKIVFTATLLILLCVGVWLYFFIREGEKQNKMDSMRAIPADAAFVVRVNDLNKLLQTLNSGGELAQGLSSEKAVSELRSSLMYIVDTMVKKEQVVGDLIQQPVWISAHVFGRDMAFLFSLNLPDNLYLTNVKQLIDVLKESGNNASEQAYDDEKIVTFKHGDVDIFHASVVRRVLVVSSSRVLVEMAVRQAKSPASLADNPDFVQASQAAGANVDANLYINHGQLNRLLPLYLDGSLSRQFGFLSRLGNFTVLDAEMHATTLQLNGFAFYDKISSSYFSVLANQSSQKLSTPNMLPRATDGALCIAVSDAKQLLTDYDTFREKQQSGNAARQDSLNRLGKKLHTEVVKFFTSLYPSELALAHVLIPDTEEKNMWFIVLKSHKIEKAQEALKNAISAVAKADNRHESDFAKSEKMSNGEPLTIYQNPAKGLIRFLQGNQFAQCTDSYFAFVGEYVVFGSSQAAIREFALAALLKKNLSQSIDLSEYTNSESNVFIYLNPSKPTAVAHGIFGEEIQKYLKKSPLIAASQGAGVQLRVMNDKVYVNAFFKVAPRPEVRQQSQTGLHVDFEIKLDAPLACAPWVVKNHTNGEKEILAQDVNNTLYLIDNQGVQVWKRTFDEPILGRVQQIDYFKNNKYQLLFNTKTKLYMLDRLGRDVEKFPITFGSPATAPVAVFDYDRSREYRYFVPLADGKIRAYERDGKLLAGFAPSASFDGNIALPLLHARVKSNDYIVVADSKTIHLLNRKGEERVTLQENIVPARNSSMQVESDASGNATRLVTTNAAGELVFIYFDGRVERSKLKPSLDKKHFFTLAGKKYIVFNDDELRVYESNLNVKLSRGFKRSAAVAPSLYTPLSNVDLYSVYIEDEQKGYLVNGSGDVVNNFPIKVVAPLVVDNLRNSASSYNVVACDANGFLSCYSVVVK